MTSKSELRAIAAAALAACPVTKIETGARSYDEQEMFDRAHGNDWHRNRRAALQPDLANVRRVHAYDHCGRAAIVNGLGERVALE